MKLEFFPDEVIQEYNLCEKVEPEKYVYTEIRKGMYGLPRAGLLVQELLAELPKKHGYKKSKITPGLWTHNWRPICFPQVVENFSVKYYANHLIAALNETYALEEDLEASKCVGISLGWDCIQGEVHSSIPG